MNRWVVGDVHGCIRSLEALIKKIHFNPSTDQLVFVGDLVGRGPNSLEVVQLIKELYSRGAALSVLGNHDLHLLAVWQGAVSYSEKDNTKALLESEGADQLLTWLLKLPLALKLSETQVAVHAGLLPSVSLNQALTDSELISSKLIGSTKEVSSFFNHMHGNTPIQRSLAVTAEDQQRFIINSMTRMRLIDSKETLNLSYKQGADGELPKGFKPWYNFRRSDALKVYFGHWAALEAKVNTAQASALDGGCVWGGRLVAEHLSTGQRVWVKSLD